MAQAKLNLYAKWNKNEDARLIATLGAGEMRSLQNRLKNTFPKVMLTVLPATASSECFSSEASFVASHTKKVKKPLTRNSKHS